jgi:hypothetical protein
MCFDNVRDGINEDICTIEDSWDFHGTFGHSPGSDTDRPTFGYILYTVAPLLLAKWPLPKTSIKE